MSHNIGLKQSIVRARVNDDLKTEVKEIPSELKIPNSTTLKAMQDIENGMDVETAENTDDLWKKLSL